MTVAVTITGAETVILTVSVRLMFVSIVSIVSITVAVLGLAVFVNVSVTVAMKTRLMVRGFAVVIVAFMVRFVVVVFGSIGGRRVFGRGVRFVRFLIVIDGSMHVFLGLGM